MTKKRDLIDDLMDKLGIDDPHKLKRLSEDVLEDIQVAIQNGNIKLEEANEKIEEQIEQLKPENYLSYRELSDRKFSESFMDMVEGYWGDITDKPYDETSFLGFAFASLIFLFVMLIFGTPIIGIILLLDYLF